MTGDTKVTFSNIYIICRVVNHITVSKMLEESVIKSWSIIRNHNQNLWSFFAHDCHCKEILSNKFVLLFCFSDVLEQRVQHSDPSEQLRLSWPASRGDGHAVLSLWRRDRGPVCSRVFRSDRVSALLHCCIGLCCLMGFSVCVCASVCRSLSRVVGVLPKGLWMIC